MTQQVSQERPMTHNTPELDGQPMHKALRSKRLPVRWQAVEMIRNNPREYNNPLVRETLERTIYSQNWEHPQLRVEMSSVLKMLRTLAGLGLEQEV